MSTTAAPRALFDRLVDDAAVFPPGNAPVQVAWTQHLAMRAGRYGDLLGPLLIGTSGARGLVDAAASAPPVEDPETGSGLDPEPVEVAVVARPGTRAEDLVTAVALVRDSPHLRVVSVELAHDGTGTWRRVLELGVPVAVEVTRDPVTQHDALDDVAEAADAAEVVAKLRTQSTAQALLPSPRELAEFFHGVRDRDLPFKLTGGLHRAVAHTEATADGSTEEQHGVLNVLVATHHLERGATLRHLVATLELRDAEALASLARGLDDHAVDELRARFRSFGCCGVLDPVTELADLDLLTD